MFLVTGTEEQLRSFFGECVFLNPCERRGDTMLCTMMADGTYKGSLEEVEKAAAQFNVTVQKRRDDLPSTGHKQDDYWPVIKQGQLPAWTSTSGLGV